MLRHAILDELNGLEFAALDRLRVAVESEHPLVTKPRRHRVVRGEEQPVRAIELSEPRLQLQGRVLGMGRKEEGANQSRGRVWSAAMGAGRTR